MLGKQREKASIIILEDFAEPVHPHRELYLSIRCKSLANLNGDLQSIAHIATFITSSAISEEPIIYEETRRGWLARAHDRELLL